MKEQAQRDIKNSCLAVFVGKELFLTVLNIAAPVLIMFIGAAITFGIVYAKETAVLKEQSSIMRTDLNNLQSQINSKLDTLIKRGNNVYYTGPGNP